MSTHLTLIPSDSDHGKRLDVYLASQQNTYEQLAHHSRTQIQKLIEESHVQVDDKVILKPSFKISADQRISIDIPEPQPLEVEKENIPLEILYQDSDIAVINKPAGMTVHPSGGVRSGTLVNALLYHLSDLSGIGGMQRPGIVHRLDKGTSGLILIAKNDAAHHQLSSGFKHREIKKTYLALVVGKPAKSQGEINFPLTRHQTERHKIAAIMKSSHGEEDRLKSGKRIRSALTRYELISSTPEISLIAVYPQTGRTHQIRVHMAQIGHIIVGDDTYGYRWDKKQKLPRKLISELQGPALHAWKLQLSHPRTGEQLHFEAPIPERLKKIIDYLGLKEHN